MDGKNILGSGIHFNNGKSFRECIRNVRMKTEFAVGVVTRAAHKYYSHLFFRDHDITVFLSPSSLC